MEEHTGDKVGIIYPTFDEYPNRLRPEQIVAYIPQNTDFVYTADDLMDFYADKSISLLLLINPDNPSGNFIPKKDVLRLASWCEDRKIRLIVDESFVDFTTGYADNSLLHNDTLQKFPTMMVMKSISKSYGVPGLRLGIFASSDTTLIAASKGSSIGISTLSVSLFANLWKVRERYAKAVEVIVERGSL